MISESDYETFTKAAIPKFEMEWGKSLTELLKQIGLAGAFEEEADFSKISPELHISEVFQKAKIIVDEPFVFIIRDVENGVILFMGDVESL